MFYIKILNSKCNHEWDDWRSAGKRPWLHYQELNRYCKKCSKVERSFKDFFCPKKMKTGEFCYWCAQFEHLFLQQIDKSEVVWDNETMKKQNRKPGRPPMVERNKEIYEMRKQGATFADIQKKFPIADSTLSELLKRIENSAYLSQE